MFELGEDPGIVVQRDPRREDGRRGVRGGGALLEESSSRFDCEDAGSRVGRDGGDRAVEALAIGRG